MFDAQTSTVHQCLYDGLHTTGQIRITCRETRDEETELVFLPSSHSPFSLGKLVFGFLLCLGRRFGCSCSFRCAGHISGGHKCRL